VIGEWVALLLLHNRSVWRRGTGLKKFCILLGKVPFRNVTLYFLTEGVSGGADEDVGELQKERGLKVYYDILRCAN